MSVDERINLLSKKVDGKISSCFKSTTRNGGSSSDEDRFIRLMASCLVFVSTNAIELPLNISLDTHVSELAPSVLVDTAISKRESNLTVTISLIL